jgi:hypothetical protein
MYNFSNTGIQDRFKRLDDLGCVWDPLAEQWEEAFIRFEEFYISNQHVLPKSTYKTVDGFALGRWVFKQRSRFDKLSTLQKNRLERLKGWTWDASDQSASAISKLGRVTLKKSS